MADKKNSDVVIKRAIAIVSLVGQLLAGLSIVLLLVSINSGGYLSVAPPEFMARMIRLFGWSKFYETQLIMAIIAHLPVFIFGLVMTYCAAITYTFLYFKEMTWNYDCLSAALWGNSLSKSYNYVAFLASSTSCIGRKVSIHEKGIGALIHSEREKQLRHVGLLIFAIGMFSFLYAVEISPKELAIFTAVSIYSTIHFTFETIAIHIIRSKQ